jgi:hypothetical protein
MGVARRSSGRTSRTRADHVPPSARQSGSVVLVAAGYLDSRGSCKGVDRAGSERLAIPEAYCAPAVRKIFDDTPAGRLRLRLARTARSPTTADQVRTTIVEVTLGSTVEVVEMRGSLDRGLYVVARIPVGCNICDSKSWDDRVLPPLGAPVAGPYRAARPVGAADQPRNGHRSRSTGGSRRRKRGRGRAGKGRPPDDGGEYRIAAWKRGPGGRHSRLR